MKVAWPQMKWGKGVGSLIQLSTSLKPSIEARVTREHICTSAVNCPLSHVCLAQKYIKYCSSWLNSLFTNITWPVYTRPSPTNTTCHMTRPSCYQICPNITCELHIISYGYIMWESYMQVASDKYNIHIWHVNSQDFRTIFIWYLFIMVYLLFLLTFCLREQCSIFGCSDVCMVSSNLCPRARLQCSKFSIILTQRPNLFIVILILASEW